MGRNRRPRQEQVIDLTADEVNDTTPSKRKRTPKQFVSSTLRSAPAKESGPTQEIHDVSSDSSGPEYSNHVLATPSRYHRAGTAPLASNITASRLGNAARRPQENSPNMPLKGSKAALSQRAESQASSNKRLGFFTEHIGQLSPEDSSKDSVKNRKKRVKLSNPPDYQPSPFYDTNQQQGQCSFVKSLGFRQQPGDSMSQPTSSSSTHDLRLEEGHLKSKLDAMKQSLSDIKIWGNESHKLLSEMSLVSTTLEAVQKQIIAGGQRSSAADVKPTKRTREDSDGEMEVTGADKGSSKKQKHISREEFVRQRDTQDADMNARSSRLNTLPSSDEPQLVIASAREVSEKVSQRPIVALDPKENVAKMPPKKLYVGEPTEWAYLSRKELNIRRAELRRPKTVKTKAAAAKHQEGLLHSDDFREAPISPTSKTRTLSKEHMRDQSSGNDKHRTAKTQSQVPSKHKETTSTSHATSTTESESLLSKGNLQNSKQCAAGQKILIHSSHTRHISSESLQTLDSISKASLPHVPTNKHPDALTESNLKTFLTHKVASVEMKEDVPESKYGGIEASAVDGTETSSSDISDSSEDDEAGYQYATRVDTSRKTLTLLSGRRSKLRESNSSSLSSIKQKSSGQGHDLYAVAHSCFDASIETSHVLSQHRSDPVIPGASRTKSTERTSPFSRDIPDSQLQITSEGDQLNRSLQQSSGDYTHEDSTAYLAHRAGLSIPCRKCYRRGHDACACGIEVRPPPLIREHNEANFRASKPGGTSRTTISPKKATEHLRDSSVTASRPSETRDKRSTQNARTCSTFQPEAQRVTEPSRPSFSANLLESEKQISPASDIDDGTEPSVSSEMELLKANEMELLKATLSHGNDFGVQLKHKASSQPGSKYDDLEKMPESKKRRRTSAGASINIGQTFESNDQELIANKSPSSPNTDRQRSGLLDAMARPMGAFIGFVFGGSQYETKIKATKNTEHNLRKSSSTQPSRTKPVSSQTSQKKKKVRLQERKERAGWLSTVYKDRIESRHPAKVDEEGFTSRITASSLVSLSSEFSSSESESMESPSPEPIHQTKAFRSQDNPNQFPKSSLTSKSPSSLPKSNLKTQQSSSGATTGGLQDAQPNPYNGYLMNSSTILAGIDASLDFCCEWDAEEELKDVKEIREGRGKGRGIGGGGGGSGGSGSGSKRRVSGRR